jgi:hypothetical protein
METNKTQDEGALALILSEVKKLTRHFKLDRRSKNDAEGAETVDADESEKLLRELSEKVGDLTDKKDFSAEQVATLERMVDAVANAIAGGQAECNEELKSSLERIEQALDTFKAEKQDGVVHHEHRHAIEIASSRVFISMVGMGLVIFLSLVLHIYQFDRIRLSRDNDLKYRYVKMHGEATPDDIEALETIFTYDRNPDSIQLIRRQVVQYERLVKEQAEKIEQAHLNASEAERLRKEVETVKGGK